MALALFSVNYLPPVGGPLVFPRSNSYIVSFTSIIYFTLCINNIYFHVYVWCRDFRFKSQSFHLISAHAFPSFCVWVMCSFIVCYVCSAELMSPSASAVECKAGGDRLVSGAPNKTRAVFSVLVLWPVPRISDQLKGQVPVRSSCHL